MQEKVMNEGSMDHSNQWHLSKTVNVSQIVTLVGVLVSVVIGAVTFDRRITTLEQEQRYLRELMQVNAAVSKDKLDQINSRLTRIESLLVSTIQDRRDRK